MTHARVNIPRRVPRPQVTQGWLVCLQMEDGGLLMIRTPALAHTCMRTSASLRLSLVVQQYNIIPVPCTKDIIQLYCILFERSEFLIATCKKKKTDRLSVWAVCSFHACN